MLKKVLLLFFISVLACTPLLSYSYEEEGDDKWYEIDGSAYTIDDTPLPPYVKSMGEKFILVDPILHAWGAYNGNGKLMRWGIASAGADWCQDMEGSCRTRTGIFRIYSLGDGECISHTFPIPEGGAPMPYCMYFNGGQAIHGSYEVEYANLSHGCIRVKISDAKWLRYHFVEGPSEDNRYRGTKIVIRDYEYDIGEY